MKDSENQVLEAIKHLVLMRLIERNESKPTNDIESIALDMLIVMERRIRGLSEPKAHPQPERKRR